MTLGVLTMKKLKGGDDRGLEKIQEISDPGVKEALTKLWMYELEEAEQKSKLYKEAYKKAIFDAVDLAEEEK